jgi:2-polyprenyl-6-methoxyphenol hydroxylase-like FAD-dependent oxidoreductase
VTDIAIIGAGLAGSVAATVLGRAGISVTMIDQVTIPLPRFRAEQLVGEQVDLLAHLGVLEQIVDGVEPVDHAVVMRRGRIVGGENGRHYGLPYHELVQRARSAVPPHVRLIEGRIGGIETGPDRQKIVLETGQVLDVRLAILATGSQARPARTAGFQRHILHRAHSLSFGFDIEPADANSVRIPLLTCRPDHVRSRIDYMTIFPRGSVWRANLFTYHDTRDPWIQHLRSDTHATICHTFQGIEDHFGAFRVTSPVQMHVTDLYTSLDPIRSGIVSIGDAFQSSCPATGMGIRRLLLDVDRLCNLHLPEWMATPGMASAKIAAFYDDPVKRKSDQLALERAEHQRLAATDTSWKWAAYRAQLDLRKRFGSLVGGPRRLTAGVTRARIQPPTPNRHRQLNLWR